MNTLLPHQQRVVDEHRRVSDDLSKLKIFIHSKRFDDVSGSEKGLMIDQSMQMERYVETLAARIKLWSA
jgi:hypothetical protein